jgi:hypothetical protein
VTAAIGIIIMAIIGASLLIVTTVAPAIGAIQTGGVVMAMGIQYTGVRAILITTVARAMDSDRITTVTVYFEI